MNNSSQLLDFFLEKFLKDKKIIVDATLGKANDSLRLIKYIRNDAILHLFDIQKIAIEIAIKEFEKIKFDRYILHNKSHEFLEDINENIDFIIYNLGYLPGSDKTIHTNRISTTTSLKKALKLLNKSGIMCVSTYPGHQEGYFEDIEVNRLFTNLEQREFNVFKICAVNQKNKPCKTYIVEKY